MTDQPRIVEFKGKRVTDMNRDEMLDLIYWLSDQYRELMADRPTAQERVARLKRSVHA